MIPTIGRKRQETVQQKRAGALRRKSQIAEGRPTEKSGNRKLTKGLLFGRTKKQENYEKKRKRHSPEQKLTWHKL